MKDTIKVFDFVNIVKRLKNDEIKPSLYLMFFIFATEATAISAHSILSAMKGYNVSEYILGVLFILSIITIILCSDISLTYIFTPKEFTFKKCCILELSTIIVGSAITIPTTLFLPQILKIFSFVLAFVLLHITLEIKKLYCPPDFKRIYVLLAIDIISIITSFVNIFTA